MENEIKINRKTIVWAFGVVALLLILGYFTNLIYGLRSRIEKVETQTNTNSEHIAEIVDFIKKATTPQQ